MTARSLEFLIPGDLQAATGGYAYDRRVIEGLRAQGWRVTVHSLDGSFPQPSPAALAHAQDVLARLPPRSLVLVDGLAAGAMPQVLQAQAARLRLLALVHHPLAAESGLAPAVAQQLAESERQALQTVRHVVVTSHATKQALQAFGVDAAKVSVAQPGTDAVSKAPTPRAEKLQMLCVATLIPRKGHDLLFDALAPLTSASWHLTCVGSVTRSPHTSQQLREQLQRLKLTERVTLAGEVDAATLAWFYSTADLFVLPTRLEGYGMAVAEALSYGLPVISTPVGGIAELVGTKAGILVAPADTAALRAALQRVLNEPALLESLTVGASAVRSTLTGWQRTCEQLALILESGDLQNPTDGR